MIYGPVGVELECFDKRPGSRRSFAVSGIQMYLDSLSEPFFVTEYDTISFDRWSEVNLELNYSRALDDDRFVHNLYLLPGHNTPVVNDLAKNGGIIEVTDPLARIDISPGVHHLLFRVQDRSGNRTDAEVVIGLRCHPEFSVSAAECSQYEEQTRWDYAVAQYRPASDRFEAVLTGQDAMPFLDYLSGNTTLARRFGDMAGEMLLLSMTSDRGARFDRLIRLSDTGMPVFSPTAYVPPSCLVSSALDSRYDPVRLDVLSLKRAWDDQTAATASLCMSLPALFNPPDSSLWVDPADVIVRDFVDAEYGKPFAVGGTGAYSVVVKFADGHLLFEPNDLTSRNAMCIDTASADVHNSGPAAMLRIRPDDLLLNDRIDLTLRLESYVEPSRTAVYMLDETGGAYHVGGDVIGDSAIHVTLSRTGIYAMLQDTVPPEISRLDPADGAQVKRPRPRITFRMEDDLSGIENDTCVEITVDGVWAIPEYDVGTRQMVTYSSQKLEPGEHVLEIRVRDRAGNEMSRSSTFYYGRR
jgi:hypothetical protein